MRRTPASPSAFEWQVVQNYQDVEEGDSVWTLKGSRRGGARQGGKDDQRCDPKGYEGEPWLGSSLLRIARRSPGLWGPRERALRVCAMKVGLISPVSRENNTIVIVGAESEINNAKDAILKLAASNNGPRGGRRHHDD
ncbi:hypothetical protein FA13DRAFT_701470 [Coprinellus micaceus]|uniref:K Homology domain-containing protein n=1 Tax=Coprinellus micaceus TaxID=71717 RepID=A0A4Y7S881_COPMI|nr:hypothetical protein FA13DRAFT_701470 [Coprinellus micaceus]